MNNMQLTSSAFANGEDIPLKYTCDGENINPPFHIFGAPEEAKSLALTMTDPDVPQEIKPDGVYDHWMVWNIPPSAEAILEGIPPEGVEGKNSSGDIGYTGPCPPDGTHRYFFTLYALDDLLNINPDITIREELLQEMEGHILRSTELMGTYKRKPERE